jgi:hypothetical protein
MWMWQVVFHAKYHGGFDIIIVEASSIQQILNERFKNNADDIISITKLLNE